MKKYFGFIILFLSSLKETFLGKEISTVEHLEFWSKKSKKRSIENGNLDSAIERATDLQHLESDSLEDYESDSSFDADFDESYEEAYQESLQEENLSSSEDLTRAQKRRMSARMNRKKGRKGGVYSARRNQLKGSYKNIEGQLTINITRDTYRIPYDLPVQVFNSLDGFCNNPLVNKYLPNSDVQFISGYVDSTVTNFVFLFRRISTGLTDTVTVSCNEVAYVKLLFGLMVDRFEVSGGTIQISDDTKTAQFNKKFTFSEQNVLGKDGANPLNMGSFIKTNQLRKDLADIQISFPVNKEKGFIFTSMYITGVVGTGYTLITTFFFNLRNIKLHR